MRIAAIVLIVLGILGLVYGGFTYVKERHKVDLGPVDIQFVEKETVNIPTWAGVGAFVAGAALFFYGRKRA